MEKAKAVKLSYYMFAACLIGFGWFGIATPFLTVLFATFALNKFKFFNREWIAVTLYIIAVICIFYGLGYFVKETVETLPKIIEQSIPKAMQYADENGVDLPFSDIETLKSQMVLGVRQQFAGIAKFTSIVTKEFVFLLIGLVISLSIFLNKQIDLDQGKYKIKNNLYYVLSEELRSRFQSFSRSFAEIMGAQMTISFINTLLTSTFIYSVQLPYAHIVVILTFLCGLLPIIGNVISNTVICSIALTVSPTLTIGALIFLVLLHKLEYFLNSRIVGSRIKNPMWLTLLALLVGERVAGIPGMILAPVILHFVKIECSQVAVKE